MANHVLANTEQREYGVDLLKIIAMFMVAVLHVLGRGGILQSTVEFSGSFFAAWTVELLCYCAVNCFAMITGYLMIDRKVKYSKLVIMWLKVVFYTLLFTAVQAIISPGEITVKALIKALFPVSSYFYWYFSCYFGLFLFMPVIMKGFHCLEKKTATVFLGVLLAICSITDLFRYDSFLLNGGYSVLWLLVMFLLGAYMKRYQPFQNINKWFFLLTYAIAVLLTVVGFLLPWDSINMLLGEHSQSLSNNLLERYTSPTIIVSGVSLFLFFTRINIKSNGLKKVLPTISLMTFFIYIIHLHPLFWNPLENFFADWAQSAPLLLMVKVLLAALSVFAGCLAVEFVRMLVFRYTGLDRLLYKLERQLDKALPQFR